MNDDLIVLLASLFGVLVIQLVVTAVSEVRRFRASRRQKIEVTRQTIAEARSTLLALVRQGKLDPDSATFQRMYYTHTFIMRRPDQYISVATALHAALDSDEHQEGLSAIRNEAKSWPKEMKSVVLTTLSGVDSLITNHSVYRQLQATSRFWSVVAGAFSSLASQSPEAKKAHEYLESAQTNLRQWASAA